MRRAFDLTVIGLSLACVAALGWLWWRSLSRVEGIEWNKQWADGTAEHHRILSFRSGDGVAYVGLSRRDGKASRTRFDTWTVYELNAKAKGSVSPFWKRRFGYDRTGNRASMESFIVAAPHWAWALLAATPGAVIVLLWRRRLRRRAAGLCPTCGYDLRASPERCPECGHARASSSATQAMPTA